LPPTATYTQTYTPKGFHVYLGSNQYDASNGAALPIHYLTVSAGEVNLRVYNVRGSVIRHLLRVNLSAGSYYHSWDGIDDQGQRVSSGLYLVVLEEGGTRDIKKLVVIRR
jgi:flagellar hook assembly protein FlgD